MAFECPKIGIVGIKRLLPGFPTSRGLVIGQIHIAVEIDVQVAKICFSREHPVTEEGGRTASRSSWIADENLASERFAAGQETGPDLLMSSRVRCSLVDCLHRLELGSGQACARILAGFALQCGRIEMAIPRVIEKRVAPYPAVLPAALGERGVGQEIELRLRKIVIRPLHA